MKNLLFVLIACVIFISCDLQDTKNALTGTAGGPCYDNGTCNNDLVCVSDICLNPDNDNDNDTNETEDEDNCLGQSEVKCCQKNVCSYNSCGEKEEIIKYCEFGCENGSCLIDPNCFWTDPDTGYAWSLRGDFFMTHNKAASYCRELGNNWRLPTIGELRTLIKNCPSTQTGGECTVKDGGCISEPCKLHCGGCSWILDGSYSKVGDGDVDLWSSTLIPANTDFVWLIDFGLARLSVETLDQNHTARCIKR